jgi:hypothetical protein
MILPTCLQNYSIYTCKCISFIFKISLAICIYQRPYAFLSMSFCSRQVLNSIQNYMKLHHGHHKRRPLNTIPSQFNPTLKFHKLFQQDIKSPICAWISQVISSLECNVHIPYFPFCMLHVPSIQLPDLSPLTKIR